MNDEQSFEKRAGWVGRGEMKVMMIDWIHLPCCFIIANLYSGEEMIGASSFPSIYRWIYPGKLRFHFLYFFNRVVLALFLLHVCEFLDVLFYLPLDY